MLGVLGFIGWRVFDSTSSPRASKQDTAVQGEQLGPPDVVPEQEIRLKMSVHEGSPYYRFRYPAAWGEVAIAGPDTYNFTNKSEATVTIRAGRAPAEGELTYAQLRERASAPNKGVNVIGTYVSVATIDPTVETQTIDYTGIQIHGSDEITVQVRKPLDEARECLENVTADQKIGTGTRATVNCFTPQEQKELEDVLASWGRK